LFIAAALIFSLGIFSFTDVHSVSAIPGNDNFASAIVINPAALPYSVSLDNSGATTEGGEATIACSKPTEGSMWWSFTPTVSGSYQIDTFGSAAPADDTHPRRVYGVSGERADDG